MQSVALACCSEGFAHTAATTGADVLHLFNACCLACLPSFALLARLAGGLARYGVVRGGTVRACASAWCVRGFVRARAMAGPAASDALAMGTAALSGPQPADRGDAADAPLPVRLEGWPWAACLRREDEA